MKGADVNEETRRERAADRRARARPLRELSPRVRTAAGIIVGLTIALCGADRIDFWMGGGGFTLTPALPLYGFAIVTLGVLWFVLRPRVSMSRRHWLALALVGALALFAFLSLGFAGLPALGLRRLVLLVFTIAGISAAVVLARWLNLVRAVRIGAWAGLSVALVLTVLQVLAWSPAAAGVPQWLGPVYVTAPTYGPVAPRPAGSSLDPNRSALFAAVMLFLLTVDPWARYRGKPRMIWLALALAAAVAVPTLSRTGLVAWSIVAVAALVVLAKEIGARRVLLPVGIAIVVVGIAALVVVAVSHLDLMRLIRERLSISLDDSGGHHLQLIALGVQTLNDHPLRWLTGIGFGMSPEVLGDFFGGSTGGNFHSFYLTFLLETGLFGLICALGLTILPLLRPGRRTLTIAVVLFSVLYQAHLDGTFWLALATVWLLPARPVSEEPFGHQTPVQQQTPVQEQTPVQQTPVQQPVAGPAGAGVSSSD